MIIYECKRKLGMPVSYFESVAEVSADFNINGANLPMADEILSLVETKSERDKCECTLISDGDEVLSVVSDAFGSNNYNDFSSVILEDDSVILRIHIEKQVVSDCLTVYDLAEFVRTLANENIPQQLKDFSIILKSQEKGLRLVVDDEDDCIVRTEGGTEKKKMATEILRTRFMVFTTDKNAFIYGGRLDCLQKCRDASVFMNMSEIPLIPQDFVTLEVEKTGRELSEIFNRLASFLSLMYIATSSNIVKEQVIFQMQPGLSLSFNSAELLPNQNLVDIYNWAFGDGESSIDRAAIARKVLNIHYNTAEHFLHVAEDILPSIKTNYNIYQKDTVEKYLDMKNKIAECISDTTKQFEDTLNNLLESVRNNFIAVITFVITLVLTDSLNMETLTRNQLPRNLQIVLGIFIIGSVAYLVITKKTVSKKWELVEYHYDKLKANYSGLMDLKDLEDAFGHDEMIIKYKQSLESYKKFVIGIWVAFIVLITVLTVMYSFDMGYWGGLLKDFLTKRASG